MAIPRINSAFGPGGPSLKIDPNITQRKKVLMLSPVFRHGGMGRTIDELSEGLRVEGREVDLVIHFPKRPFHLIRKGETEGTEYKSIEELLREINPDEYEIIHTHTFTFADELEGGLKRIREVLPGAPLIYTLHDNPFREYKIPSWKRAVSETAKRADRIVHISRYMQEAQENGFPFDIKDKGVVFGHGTKFMGYYKNPKVVSRAKEIRREVAKDGEKVILFTGRSAPRKGLVELTQAFESLYSEGLIDNTRLVIVSDLSPEKIEEARKSLPSSKDHITFKDWIKDDDIELAASYSMADRFVLPSWEEPYGLVPLEALCMGTPVIATRSGGPTELYIEPGFAEGCEPKDVGSLKSALLRSLNDSKAKEKAETARVELTRRHQWLEKAKEMNQIYTSTLEQRDTERKIIDQGINYSREGLVDKAEAEFTKIRGENWLLEDSKGLKKAGEYQGELYKLRLYKEALEDSKNGNSKEAIGLEFEKVDKKEWPNAGKGFIGVIAADYMHRAAWLGLVKELEKTNQNDLGLAAIDEVVNYVDPLSAEAHALKARLLAKQGRTVEAVDSINKAEKLGYKEAGELKKEITPKKLEGATDIETAINYATVSQHKRANYYFWKAQKADPNSQLVNYHKAINELALGNRPSALSLLEKVIKQCPSSLERAARDKVTDLEVQKTTEELKTQKYDVMYIVPCYNENPEHTKQVVESVLEKQDYSGNIGMILIDDGSTKGLTAEKARELFSKHISSGKLKVISKRNGGAASARNLGIKLALESNARYISFLDGAEVALPKRTANLVDYLQINNLDFVHSNARTIDQYEKDFPEHPYSGWHERRKRQFKSRDLNPKNNRTIAYTSQIHAQTTMSTREIIEKAGYQNVLWRRAQDWRFWGSIARAGAKIGYLDQELTLFRQERK